MNVSTEVLKNVKALPIRMPALYNTNLIEAKQIAVNQIEHIK